MRILAQHGFGVGERLERGLADGLIDGVIFGAKDIAAGSVAGELREMAANHPAEIRLFDPQYYACLMAAEPGARLGALNGEEKHAYFGPRRRRDLEQERQVVSDLESCLDYQRTLAVTGFISPNIAIRRSLDSVEATIAKDFLRNAAVVHERLRDPRPLWATLAISTEALRDRIELQNFLQEITELENPPAGFYLLIEHADQEILPTLEESDVLSRWMLINRALTQSGYEVINGYADLLAPYLGAAGATGAASGWWNTLKVFSLRKFGPSPGAARQPVPRYASAALLKSIRYTELDSLRGDFPEVLNGDATDAYYEEDGERPRGLEETLQNWACLRRLAGLVIPGSAERTLSGCEAALERAEDIYARIGAMGLTLRLRSNQEHIQFVREELAAFRVLAEL
jgi:hypothetical protein